MANITKFKHKKRICLKYHAICNLSGVSNAGEIIAEEYYDDAFFAWHHITASGDIIKTQDENYGQHTIQMPDVSSDWKLPQRPPSHPLNYTGLRFRGMREADKVAEWVKPLSMLEKMPLLQLLNLSVPPMMVMGIAESRVLAETQWTSSRTIVCRRVQLLIALAEVQIDSNGLPYNYETQHLHVIHPYQQDAEDYPALHDAIGLFPRLTQPTDCLFTGDHLIVAESGESGERKSAIHVYHLDEHDS